MDHSFIHHPEKWEQMLAVLIAAITVIIVILNGYGLMFGITNVLPHLFYIPIILTAYFFPRRGTLFAIAVSAIYCGMTYVFNPIIPGDLLSAGGRVIIFILIAVVVSFLTTRLRESEEKYRLLADYTYDWEYWIGSDESILYTTPSCERITGYTAGEFYADRNLINTIIHPDDKDALGHHMSHFFVPRNAESLDFRIICRDGSVRWIGHICLPLHNAKGEFIGRRVSNRDITGRKQAEDEYRETSRRLAEMIDFLPDPTMIIDRSGVVVSWNRAMEQMSGIPASVILGRGKPSYTTWISNHTGPILIDYVLCGDTEGIKTAYSNVHFDGNTVRTEADITHVNGTRLSLWISATPLIDESGEVSGAIESVRDVSDIKRIQRALRESNAYLDTVINTLADPLFIKDRSHCFVKLNNAFCHFSGHTREDLLGKSDYDFFKKEEADIFWEKDEEVFRTRRENENEECFTDSQGNTHTISTKKSLYINTAGEEFIVGIIRDITGRKLAEEALRLANRKLNLLSGITRHDIRNQLLALEAYLEISKESLEDPVQTAKFVAREEKIAETIAHQITFTKDYEDLGVNTPQWQNVNTVIRRVVARLPMRTIRIDEAAPDLEMYADPLLEKVFYNLIDNALRYGGEKMSALRMTSREENGALVIALEDDGNGISAEDKKQLFNKGFGKHTGLGLYLSREILAITGITITETGIPGTGARFEIMVPKGVYRFTG
ncbi:PAS domain S-box protein [Methanoregula sp.]|uniref:PAS domain S-box protein n=1 Tax=Methanoregula sp. TaxID=2052170 RepID=UPI003C736710